MAPRGPPRSLASGLKFRPGTEGSGDAAARVRAARVGRTPIGDELKSRGSRQSCGTSDHRASNETPRSRADQRAAEGFGAEPRGLGWAGEFFVPCRLSVFKFPRQLNDPGCVAPSEGRDAWDGIPRAVRSASCAPLGLCVARERAKGRSASVWEIRKTRTSRFKETWKAVLPVRYCGGNLG